jgi:hypothetical protein
MLATDILERYLSSLLESPAIWTKYASSVAWTSEATRALVNVGLQAYPSGHAVARGHRGDAYQRSEYLTLDVCVADPSSWAPPWFIAEHENASHRTKIQYCAWKLLATRADRRVLVAYYDGKSDVPEQAALEAAVREVCADNPGNGGSTDIVLITADSRSRPTSADVLRAIHAVSVVGAST